MRWQFIAAVVASLGIWAGTAVGDEFAGDCLLHTKPCGTFRIVLGKLQLDGSSRYRRGRNSVVGPELSETVDVTATRGVPSLRYVRISRAAHLTLEVDHATHVQITLRRHDASGGTRRLSIDQPDAGKVRYEYESEQGRRAGAVRSLWHLAVAEPALFATEVAPLLRMLVGPLPVGSVTGEVHDLMRQRMDARARPLREEVLALVQQLAAERRQERIAAQQRLQSLGLTVLPILDDVDPRRLDREQVGRLDAVRRALVPRRHDTPERLARWLAADRSYWNAMAADWPSRDRQAADRYLRGVCGQGLAPADPDAPRGPDANLAETPRTVR